MADSDRGVFHTVYQLFLNNEATYNVRDNCSNTTHQQRQYSEWTVQSVRE